MNKFTVGDFLAIALAVWITILCGGFAYLYWFVGFTDPRTLGAPGWLMHIGALVVFPVGWICLVVEALSGRHY